MKFHTSKRWIGSCFLKNLCIDTISLDFVPSSYNLLALSCVSNTIQAVLEISSLGETAMPINERSLNCACWKNFEKRVTTLKIVFVGLKIRTVTWMVYLIFIFVARSNEPLKLGMWTLDWRELKCNHMFQKEDVSIRRKLQILWLSDILSLP